MISTNLSMAATNTGIEAVANTKAAVTLNIIFFLAMSHSLRSANIYCNVLSKKFMLKL